MRRGVWIVLLVALLSTVAYVYRRPIVLRLVGVRPFVEERVGWWVGAGATEEELDRALRHTYDPAGSGPGSWVYEISIPAADHQRRAQKAERAGDLAAAAREYAEAAVFYYIARFPFVSSPAKADAYRKHIDCYLKAIEYGDGPPMEIVRIRFAGEEIIGYLRLPPGVEHPPVVVLTGGIDTWKSDIELHVRAILAEGLAAFTFDMPGTGESPWALTADADRVYSRVLEYLKARTDLDGDRMGVYCLSFAGNYAVKLALLDRNVKAAVNVGGPIHLSFTVEYARRVPGAMVRAIAHSMGTSVDRPLAQLITQIEPFSLSEQGLLVPPERQAALLSINGDQDGQVPIEDLYIISRSGIEQEEWVYEGAGHCAPERFSEHIPRSAAWLKARLTGAEPSRVESEARAAEPGVTMFQTAACF